MEIAGVPTFEAVKDVVVTTLDLQESAERLGPATRLLGSLPELDSMAVVELISALESRFDLVFDDEEITAEVFHTLGALVEFMTVKCVGR
ncbi:acyl carrier protein [Micromonospora okii]|uniref:acyl carrier protein n=1 Tax=Micromonospora okii TaxID=1182970 RepID=UPI001E491E70|nr:acyl carrier protein [Micromonospora okii]